MFRSAGYYRGVNCPFFASGLCERPYCHFRHVKQDHNEDLNSRSQTPSKDASTYLEKLSDGQFPLTSESIKSFCKDSDVDVSEEKSNNQLFNKYTGEPIVNQETEHYELGPNVTDLNEVNKYTGKPVEYNKYTGEPIYHKEDTTSSSLNKRWNDAVLGSSTPTYNPTPLSELQKRNPNLNKYSLSASTSTSSQEYDPESNYSTSTKSHHVSVPQVGRPSYTSKRSCSYDPSNAQYKKPVLKRQRVASFFDAKFSSDEEEENANVDTSNKKDEKTVSSDKEEKFHLKDVNYFEKLLDGPKDVDVKKGRVKVESDDSLDSLDDDVDVTPLLEKCRRRSQSGGTDHDSTEEKTDVRSKVSNADKGDGSHTNTEIVSKKAKESSDSTDRKTKKKSRVELIPSTVDESDKSTEICDRNNKKNHSIHSKSSHQGTSTHKSLKESSSSKISPGNGNSTHKSLKESSSSKIPPGNGSSTHKSLKESSSSKTPPGNGSSTHKSLKESSSSKIPPGNGSSTHKSLKESSSSKISQGNGSSTHKSTKDSSSSKVSHQATGNSSHKSSKDSSTKSSHQNTEYTKSSQSSDKSSHHPSSQKSHSSTSSCEVQEVISKRKSRDSQDSKSSETENHLCNTAKSKTLPKSSSSNPSKHSRHSNSESSSLSSDKPQHNSEKSCNKNSAHNSSHSSGSSKGSKDKQNRAKQKDSQKSKCDKKRTKSVSSERRKSSETTKKKIVDVNVDLFGADSEDEDDDNDLVEVPMATDGHLSESDMVAFLNDSDYSDEDIDRYDECLRIFQENKGVQNNSNKKKSSPEKAHDANAPPAPSGKQRMAHKKDSEFARKLKVFEKPKSKMSPAEVMHNRFLQLQKRAQEAADAAAAAAESGSNGTAMSSTAKRSLLSGSKKRTAHNPSTSKSNGTSLEKTVVTTASRTEKRKARTPNVPNLTRPTIPSEFGSKVPFNVRQRYLNLIIDECLKICDTEKEAFDKGQVEEAAVYKRASSKTVYLNVAVNTIKRLRTEQAGPSNSKKPKQTVFQLSHEQILGGKNATKTTFTINRSGGGSKLQEENFKGADLYKRLSRYILTEEQLKENGFPRPSPDVSGSAVFFVEPRKKINVQSSKPTNYEKLCIRCGKMFTVYPNGTYAIKEECTHHWGKAWKKRVAGMIDTRYTCCQGDLSSDGCQIAKGHVHETNKWETLSGYMKTFPCSPPCDGDYGVFAMDCEMVYTKIGLELARVTVTDPENDCVYETLVKPDAAVIDYNTRFSGLTEEDLRNVTTTLRDVQAVLLSLFSDRTIVMGHSLESDFSTVKLLHNTVVDTSVVFPHKMGPPYKRALKTLMAEYLKKIIQDDVGGHDSKEDSTSCMELMHLKIKEDARKEPRRS